MAEISKFFPVQPLSHKQEMEGVMQFLESSLNAGSLGLKPVASLPDKDALALFYVNAADSWVCGPAAIGLAAIAATAAVAAATVGAVATLAAAAAAIGASMNIYASLPLDNEDAAKFNVTQLLARRENVLV